jgi:hypothetical protein
MGGRGMHIEYWWESQKKDKVVGGGTIIKWILERQDGAVWTGLIWFRIGTSRGFL